MATHAPWGAGNDPPQALPGGIIISLDFYILFCQQIADSYDKFRLDSDLGLLTFLVVFDSYFSILLHSETLGLPSLCIPTW